MKLLEKFILKNLELKNRVVMPPMDNYRSNEGFVNDYHIVHYGARTSVGLIIQEATAVRKDGRISSEDLGIWNDDFIDGLKKIVETVHNLEGKIAIQLSDAGRKSTLKNIDLLSPSGIRFSDYFGNAIEMTKEDIINEIELFKQAAIRAQKCGYDAIEIHGAHGYLISQFISEFSNKRTDEYGGSLENRFRFLKNILLEIRTVFKGVIGVRVSADEWVENGMKAKDMAEGLKYVKDYIDYISVSTGGTVNDGILPFYPGYQLEHAKIIKNIVGLPVIAVGLIENFDLAEYAIQNYNIDLIAIGRALLRNPNWIYEQCYENKIALDKEIKRRYVNEKFVEKNLKR